MLLYSAHCQAGGHKKCHGRRLGYAPGHDSQTLIPCQCGCHNGTGTREIDRLRAEVGQLRTLLVGVLYADEEAIEQAKKDIDTWLGAEEGA